MVTQIKKNQKGSSTTDATNMETFADNTKRVTGIVDHAIKASQSHMTTLQEAFAASYYRAIAHGRLDELNRLYVGLNEADAFAMRSWAIPRVTDLFGVGGERDPEDNTKWAKRPVEVIRFRAKPETSGPDAGLHLYMVKTGDGTKLSAVEVENVKATKRAVIEAGEPALKFRWITRDAMNALAAAYDAVAAEKDAVRFLMKWSKNGPVIGKSVDDIRKLGLFIGLSAADMSKVIGAFGDNAKKPEAAANESSPAESTTIPAEHPSQIQAAA